jgi:hypothetical protein
MIGDRPDLGLDEPFGPLNLQWHAFGSNPSNLSTIGLGAKPGRSLTERITNATDAILDDRLLPNITPPPSAKQAAKQWFGRPLTGPDDNVYEWILKDLDLSRRIVVAILPSGKEDSPTIDVYDDGTGIAPESFASTILSLQAGNKITKRYLVGAFGQGGAATLGFCDYAIIFSRSRERPDSIGFTVARVLNLNETYKVDCYGYLCFNEEGKIVVPAVAVGSAPLEIYPNVVGVKLPTLSRGTVVRHINYRLSGLSNRLSPSPGNLYHYLHFSMFDPLLPFRVIDLRPPARDEVVTGSRNRLMKLASKGAPEEENEDRGSVIKHHRQMEYISPLGSDETSIGVEYWVVLNYRKDQQKKGGVVLRPNSSELYIQRGHPIVGTMNGQNQGEKTAQLLKEIGLGMVARHIVIHIDATDSSSRVRRELFSTSREGFKDGPILDDLMRVLKKMLEEDENLYAIERELTERMAKREIEATSQEVRRQLTKLLMDAGLQVREEGPTYGKGADDKQPVVTRKTRRYRVFDPLPTLPFPGVTTFKIVSPQSALECRLGDTELVLVETDADAEYDRQGRLAIRSEPDLLEQAGKAPLRGGRVRWRLRAKAQAKVGEVGIVTVTLTKPDGTQLTDDLLYEILPAPEEHAKKEKGYIPPFDIIPINPYDDQEDWGRVWEELAEGCADADYETVAYKPMKLGGRIAVYYSTVFGPFKNQVEKLKTESPALYQLFLNNYEVWIGYHAILQFNNPTVKEELDQDILDVLLEEDRSRVGRMQVRQAMQSAQLTQELMKSQTVND